MKRFIDLTVAQQQVQMAQYDRLNFAQLFFFRRKSLVGSRQKLHKKKHQQMDGFFVRFLQIDNAVQATGKIGLVTGATESMQMTIYTYMLFVFNIKFGISQPSCYFFTCNIE